MDRKNRIRTIVAEFAGIEKPIEQVADADDLFDAGMTSQGSVALLTGIEVEFDVEIPDEMITSVTFASIDSIDSALEAAGV